MDVTELIPSLNNFVFQNRTVDTTLQIRNIIYRASRSQIAPQLSLTYLTSRTNPVRPPETLGNKWMLDSFFMIKEDAADYDTISCTYTEYTSSTSDPIDLRRKICKKVLFMSMTAEEYADYKRQQAGQIDEDKIDTVIRVCADDFSGGLKAGDVVSYVANLVDVNVQITGLYDYWIRQYRLTENQSLLDVIRNLFGFYRPLITFVNGKVTIKSEPLCRTTNEDFCDFTYPEFARVTYEEQRIRDYVDGVVLEGGVGKFDPNRAQVKLGQRHKVCLTSEAWHGGNGSTAESCYLVDEFGRKILVSTRKWDYAEDTGGVSVYGGSSGGIIKTHNTERHYKYNDITHEEPVMLSEEIWGREVVITTDDQGQKVGIGGICDLAGSKIMHYNSNDGKVEAIEEHQDTLISPVTLITVDHAGQTDKHDNETVHKRTTRTEIYHRSNAEEYGVSVAQTTENPVFKMPQHEDDTFNKHTEVDHTEISSETSFQEAFGEPTRNKPRIRKMKIKATSGSTSGTSCSVLYVSNPHIVVASDADRIASFLNSNQCSVTGNYICRAEVVTHNDTVYPIGSKLPNSNAGWVVGQEITLTLGAGTIGFDLNNRIIIEGRFTRDDT